MRTFSAKKFFFRYNVYKGKIWKYEEKEDKEPKKIQNIKYRISTIWTGAYWQLSKTYKSLFIGYFVRANARFLWIKKKKFLILFGLICPHEGDLPVEMILATTLRFQVVYSNKKKLKQKKQLNQQERASILVSLIKQMVSKFYADQ